MLLKVAKSVHININIYYVEHVCRPRLLQKDIILHVFPLFEIK